MFAEASYHGLIRAGWDVAVLVEDRQILDVDLLRLLRPNQRGEDAVVLGKHQLCLLGWDEPMSKAR